MLSLSTAFNISRLKSWPKLLAETRSFGLTCLELNVEVPEKWIRDIERSVERGEITISSLHNYCPRLEDLPENRTIYSGFHLTSDDEEEREKAVRFTRRTIETAARLGAKAVVIHAGEVRTEPSGREFVRYMQQFGRRGRLYDQYFEAISADRAKKAGRYLAILERSLDEILPLAAGKKILIGLENRYHFHEIPNIVEMQELLNKYDGAPVGYWHDTGHAEVFVRLGWVKEHADYLRPLHAKMIGLHLHDLRSLSDHYAPGSGDFDFDLLKPYLSPGLLLVIEAHAKSTVGEVQNSVEYLKRTGIA